MHTRQLGNTDIQITPIGLGAWAMGGGGWSFAWGPQDDNSSIHTINRALDLGINWIDTAPVYGLGHAEEVIGRAIRGRPEKPYIFTKCTRLWNEKGEIRGSLKAASIQHELEESLQRLGVDVIDLYQIHWPDPEEDIEEAWTAMSKLKKEGKVRAIGVSNFNVEQMRRIKRIAPIDSLQPPYSLIHPEVQEDILPYCEQQGIGVIVYSPMASGLLSGLMSKERIKNMPDDDWRKNSPDYQDPRLSRNLQLAQLLSDIGYLHGMPAGAIAIAWTLQNPAVTGAIVGVRDPRQIEDLLSAAEYRLTDVELEQINTFLEDNP